MRAPAPHDRESDISGPVLALDTTGSLGSVALGFVGAGSAVSGEVVRTFEPSNRHAANLLPAIRQVLAEAGITCADLSLVVATRGPGSFTGLRIGLATLLGLALAGGTRAAGVSSLDAAALADSAGDGAPRRRLALVDALRGEVFAAIYERDGFTNAVAGPVRLSPPAAAQWGRDHRVDRICGPALARYRKVLAGGAPGIEIGDGSVPLAPAALRLGLEEVRGGDLTLEPLYLRAPDIHGSGRGSDTL